MLITAAASKKAKRGLILTPNAWLLCTQYYVCMAVLNETRAPSMEVKLAVRLGNYGRPTNR